METHEKIRLMRELNKWSQEDMAEKLAMSAGGYAKIERGETQLNIPRLEQLAQIFKIDMWDLLKSGGGGMVFQINEGDSGGDIALYASGDVSMKIEFLKNGVETLQRNVGTKRQRNRAAPQADRNRLNRYAV